MNIWRGSIMQLTGKANKNEVTSQIIVLIHSRYEECSC